MKVSSSIIEAKSASPATLGEDDDDDDEDDASASVGGAPGLVAIVRSIEPSAVCTIMLTCHVTAELHVFVVRRRNSATGSGASVHIP